MGELFRRFWMPVALAEELAGMDSAASHRRISGDISRASGCVVLDLDYRLAPEAPFPVAVADAVAAYTLNVGERTGGTFTGG